MMKNQLMEQLRAQISPEDKAAIDASFAIADRLSFLLKKHHINQKQLADKLNKKQSEISKWLSGGHNFTIDTLSRISTAIGENVYSIPVEQPVQNDVKEHRLLHTIIHYAIEPHENRSITKYEIFDNITVLRQIGNVIRTERNTSRRKVRDFTIANLGTNAFKNIERYTTL